MEYANLVEVPGGEVVATDSLKGLVYARGWWIMHFAGESHTFALLGEKTMLEINRPGGHPPRVWVRDSTVSEDDADDEITYEFLYDTAKELLDHLVIWRDAILSDEQPSSGDVGGPIFRLTKNDIVNAGGLPGLEAAFRVGVLGIRVMVDASLPILDQRIAKLEASSGGEDGASLLSALKDTRDMVERIGNAVEATFDSTVKWGNHAQAALDAALSWNDPEPAWSDEDVEALINAYLRAPLESIPDDYTGDEYVSMMARPPPTIMLNPKAKDAFDPVKFIGPTARINSPLSKMSTDAIVDGVKSGDKALADMIKKMAETYRDDERKAAEATLPGPENAELLKMAYAEIEENKNIFMEVSKDMKIGNTVVNAIFTHPFIRKLDDFAMAKVKQGEHLGDKASKWAVGKGESLKAWLKKVGAWFKKVFTFGKKRRALLEAKVQSEGLELGEASTVQSAHTALSQKEGAALLVELEELSKEQDEMRDGEAVADLQEKLKERSGPPAPGEVLERIEAKKEAREVKNKISASPDITLGKAFLKGIKISDKIEIKKGPKVHKGELHVEVKDPQERDKTKAKVEAKWQYTNGKGLSVEAVAKAQVEGVAIGRTKADYFISVFPKFEKTTKSGGKLRTGIFVSVSVPMERSEDTGKMVNKGTVLDSRSYFTYSWASKRSVNFQVDVKVTPSAMMAKLSTYYQTGLPSGALFVVGLSTQWNTAVQSMPQITQSIKLTHRYGSGRSIAFTASMSQFTMSQVQQGADAKSLRMSVNVGCAFVI